ncbi:hypothetical protein Tsubulata_009827 [Turnera subulata]|uniref:Replication protein A OB domain-containing protein n=1 Tax=Turnera subulata TaxID=218843 RepID=A0A9Q0JKF4_9ROSI|nr:hypothetical protein Tsubulata_009827 [Turnera subulata]
MEITPLGAIQPFQQVAKIQVRLCRIWKTKDQKDENEVKSIDCVMVDVQGTGIHATMEPKIKSFFMPKLIPGTIYEIQEIVAVRNRKFNIVVSHEAMLEFRRKTKVKAIQYDGPAMPLHFFNFIKYENIAASKDGQLKDVIGYLEGIQQVQRQSCNRNQIEDKMEFILLDDRKNKARVTLWASYARTFDQQTLEAQSHPIIVVFTSVKPTNFRGGIQHLQKKSLEELLLLNPNDNQNNHFICEATIVDIDTKPRWCYKACHTCYKKLDESTGAPVCPQHGIINGLPLPWYKIHCIVQDDVEQTTFILMGRTAEKALNITCYNLFYEQENSNPHVLPTVVSNLIGCQKLFQVRFGKPKLSSSRCDLIVTYIHDDFSQSPIALTLSSQSSLSQTLENTSKSFQTPSTPGTPYIEKKSSTKRKLAFQSGGEENPKTR